MQSGKGRILLRAVLPTLPRPLMVGAFSMPWQRRTNPWRERTNLRTRAERLRGVGPPVVVTAPTDARVIAGTILGIAGMAINASMYWRPW